MNVAEILISAKENLAGLNRMKAELRALGVTAQDTAKRADLANRLMTMGVDPARAINMVAKSWVEVESKVEGANKSLQRGQQAAAGLSQILGVQLPQAATRFLGASQTIGPILAGAFSAVGVLALIQALGQLPAMFEKLKGVVTGWDDTAQKAYRDQIALNKQFIEILQEAQGEQIKLKQQFGMIDSIEANRQLVAQKLAEKKIQDDIAASARAELNIRKQIEMLGGGAELAGTGVVVPTASKETLGELNERLAQATAEANKLHLEIQKLQTIEGPKAAAEDTAKWFVKAEASAKEFQAALDQSRRLAVSLQLALRDIPLKAIPTDIVSRPIRMAEIEGLEAADHLRRSLQNALDFDIPITAPKMPIQGLTPPKLIGLQGGDFRHPIFSEDPFGLEEKGLKELEQAQQRFLESFRDGAGRVWDAFTARGLSAMQKLANIGSMLLDTIGRNLFQNFATGLLAGGKGGGGGGIGGAIGNLGAGIGAKMGLGSLFAAKPAIAGGFLPVFGGGGAATGLTGALGLGGGAGLLGLGAATIPVIGGIALGAFLIGKHFLGHKTQEAPFTKDPFQEFSQTLEFYTAGQVEAIRDLRAAIQHLNSLPAKNIVTQGLPDALQSSNQFRREMQSVLMDDV